MPITPEQQSKIIFYLGYPARVLDPTSDFYSLPVVYRISNFDDLTVANIAMLLTNLDTTYQQILDCQSLMISDGVGDIKINKDKFKDLQKSKAFWVRKLSQTTGLMLGEAIEEGSSTVRVSY